MTLKKPHYLVVGMIHKFLDHSVMMKNIESTKTDDADKKKKISEEIASLCAFYAKCDLPGYTKAAGRRASSNFWDVV